MRWSRVYTQGVDMCVSMCRYMYTCVCSIRVCVRFDHIFINVCMYMWAYV